MSRTDSPPQPPIAVVGVGAIMPGSTDAAGFWNSIVRGEDLITEVPRSHWLVEDYYDPDPAAIDKTYVRRGSFLPTIDFDPAEFGIPPSTVPATDTAQLFALKVADQTLRDALGDEYDTADRGGIGCILGSGNLELLSEIDLRLGRPMWFKALRELGYSDADARRTCDHVLKDYPQWQEATLPGGLGNIVAGRIANRLNLHAVNYTVDAACASSLAAVSAGVNELVLGRADMIISGGVDALNNPCTFVSFCKTPALSPTEDCRPFSAQADGTLLGEGVAMVALKRLDDARRDGNKIYAVIRGIGSSSDGRGAAIYAPAPGGQVRAVRAAYADAGYGPATVELVEAHGTGTVVGDRTEVTALTEVFGADERADDRRCALGSVKSQIGHTKSAAGAAGLVKAVLALHHHTLPPTIKVTEPNADLALDSSPFYLNTVCRPWVRPADHPRRASVSSFGFGGINFHIALEEAPAHAGNGSGGSAPRRPRAAGSELILFGAESPEEIVAALRAIDTARPPTGIARASRREFDPRHPVRLALVAGSAEQLGTRIDQAANLIGQRPREPFTNPRGLHYAVTTDESGTGIPPAPPPSAAPPAFLFPGQGSQYVGMGTDVALRYPAAQEVWDRFGGLRFGGTALHQMVFPPPTFDDAERAAQQSTLTAAEWAQPAIALHSLALLAVLDGYGVRPRCVAGHSFGELTALCAAGVLDAESLIILARRRGEVLRNTTERAGGRMLAAVASNDDVAAALDGLPDPDVWVANRNAPKQLVLSGAAAPLEIVQGKLAAEGIATRWLETATAFHSPLVAAARDPLRAVLDGIEIHPARFDVVGCADGRPYPDDPALIRERIVDQLTAQVLFVDQIETMYADGVRTFVEVGPGGTLTGLVNQILDGREHLAISLDRRGQDGDAMLQSALGQLAIQGTQLTFDDPPPTPVGARRRKPVMTMRIDGSNYGRNYPPPLDEPSPNGDHAPRSAATAAASAAAVATPTVPAPATADDVTAPPPPTALPTAQPGPIAVDGAIPTAPTAPTAPAAPAAEPATPPGPSPRATETAVAAPVAAPPAAEPMPAPPPAEPMPAASWLAEPGATAAEMATPAVAAAEASATAPPAAVPVTAAQWSVAAPTPGAALAGDVVAGPGQWPAFVEAHRQTAQVQAAYQQLMTEAQVEFLRTSEAICARLAGAPVTISPATGYLPATPATTPAALPPAVAPTASMPATATPPSPLARPPSAVVAPSVVAPSVVAPSVASSVATADGAIPVPPASAGQLAVGPPAADSALPAVALAPAGDALTSAGDEVVGASAPRSVEELEALLLDVVAERTGYPVAALAMDMELEGDLGIDSLKKVEILSALRQHVGEIGVDVSESDALARLTALRTLGEVVDLMRNQPGVPEPAAPAAIPEFAESLTGDASETMAATPMQGPTGVAADAPFPAGSAEGTAGWQPLTRLVPQVRPVAAPGLEPLGLGAGPLTIVDGGSGMGSALADELDRHGIRAVVTDEAPPAGAGATPGGLPADVGGVILLGGLADVDSVEQALDRQKEAFGWARAMAASPAVHGGLFVTVQDTGADLGLDGRQGERAWLGGLAALARTAGAEWPDAAVRAIDCERAGRDPARLAAVLAHELRQGGMTPVVGLRADGTRIVPGVVPTPATPADAHPLRLAPGAVVVATGGARGVTAASMIELARSCQPRLVLLGRTPLLDEPDGLAAATDEPSLVRLLAGRDGSAGGPARLRAQAQEILAVREVRATLATLRRAGSQVRYLSVDVRDHHAVARVLDEVRADWGPISGLIHGAGTLADKLLVDKTDDAFDRVFDTKVRGLRTLLDVLVDDPVELLCLFSSVAGWFGNAGQADYAMANATLDQVAAAWRAAHPDCLVRSIAWGPWAGGMVGPLLAEVFASRGVPTIPVAQGAAAFVDEITGPHSAGTQPRILLGAGGPEALGAGAGAGFGPSAARRILGQLSVHERTHPWLSDHSPADIAVLPLAMALDWLARGARALRGDSEGEGGMVLRDLRVLRKIAFPHLADTGHELFVSVAGSDPRRDGDPSGAATAPLPVLRIDDADGMPHYQARLDPARPQPVPASAWPTPEGLAEKAAEVSTCRDLIYRSDALFHGPRFQAIQWLRGMSEHGAEGSVVGVGELAWGLDDWYFDVAGLDGGMQLAGLWAWRVLGGALPVAVRECRIHRPGLMTGAARSVVTAREIDNIHALCDVVILDDDAARIELLGVELVRRPDWMPSS
ncbi:type I polyketide synthase [Frankia gtarii]|uniref:type I polyketide synthase n=1 Tax=Frankia gtarii TaxID=2950102 RepID=UPI0021BE2413|nr:type I polyketide synthase [Frankia gtarii]